MDIKYHVETAWKLFFNNLLSLIILTLVVAAVSVISLMILSPVALAGYIDSLYKLLKYNREPKAQDVFSKINLFFPLFLFGIAVVIITAIGFTLFVIPGFVFSIIIGYTCMYVLPVMVDKQYGIVDAIKKSIAIVTQSRVSDHIIVFIIFSALTTIGGSSFIGFVFLQPLACLFLLSVYDSCR